MNSNDGIEVLVSVVTGVATGIFVGLLFEFKRWLKNRSARKTQILYIKDFIKSEKMSIAEFTDCHATQVQQVTGMHVQKEQMQFARLVETLRQAKIIAETRSPNLTNEQRSEFLTMIAGISDMVSMLEKNGKIPRTKFFDDRFDEIEQIEWLRSD